MEPLKKQLKELETDLDQATTKLNLTDKQKTLEGLRTQMAKPDFWQHNKQAQDISKQQADLDRQVKPWLQLRAIFKELEELIELNDPQTIPEIQFQLDEAEKKLVRQKKDLRFQSQYDDHNAILSIYAGAGGTDAQDWAQMLLRMYVRWAEAHKLNVKTVDESPGEEAGTKSVTIELFGGNYLYGKLAGEHGVHRLVRLSPFNSAASRETSFAKVDVLPTIDKPDEVLIDEKDLRIDTFRAGGHGGQSVNTTDSAVRVTHVPTGISVAIQNERSQLQNKETALTILRSRLAQLQVEQHAETLSEIKGPSQANEFGSQIRNYVLHPYKQVKDLRSGYESSDVEKVLGGELDPLIEAGLEKG
jgi:peptide chain release factor 2